MLGFGRAAQDNLDVVELLKEGRGGGLGQKLEILLEMLGDQALGLGCRGLRRLYRGVVRRLRIDKVEVFAALGLVIVNILKIFVSDDGIRNKDAVFIDFYLCELRQLDCINDYFGIFEWKRLLDEKVIVVDL